MFARTIARELFARPGAVTAHTRHLLAQAAGSHARLLDSSAAAHHRQLDRLRASLDAYLRGSAPATEKRFVLDDPHFVEALHALASTSALLAGWDATVAPGCGGEPSTRQATLGRGGLGNIVIAVLLRHNRGWCGRIELASDEYGRVHLPFSDWALVLVDQHELFGHETLVVELGARHAHWSLAGAVPRRLVSMPRSTFDAMFVDNRDELPPRGVEFFSGRPQARFERASRLGNTPVRYEPISSDAPAEHAELTGGIVLALLEAIEQNAPRIHTQLCQCIRTIQGFEVPSYGNGQIASFSVPTSPGVIGLNVQYTARDEPRLSPYCFMWLGHELGHTISYLIDDVAYGHGWRFLENPGEETPLLARYGRCLSVRTLFSIPYVHLFEWWLLMLFCQRGFAGLPWQMFDDAQAVGQDVRAEIEEAFDLIDQHARLTAMGIAVVARLRELTAEANAHWRRLSFAAMR